MLSFITLIIIPEAFVVTITYYFCEGGASYQVLLLYFLPLIGSFLPFLMLRRASDLEGPDITGYLNVTGMSVISLFYNSTALLMWKLGAKFSWILPILVLEPIVGLIYYKKVKGFEIEDFPDF